MYQKNIENGYIVSIVSGVSSGNITEDEYNEILTAIHSKPQAEPGYDYRLREDLTWELYELPEPPEPEEEELTAEEALGIMTGGAHGT